MQGTAFLIAYGENDIITSYNTSNRSQAAWGSRMEAQREEVSELRHMRGIRDRTGGVLFTGMGRGGIYVLACDPGFAARLCGAGACAGGAAGGSAAEDLVWVLCAVPGVDARISCGPGAFCQRMDGEFWRYGILL